jgi:uncharacterized phage infection (PIP) family protein YhgE
MSALLSMLWHYRSPDIQCQSRAGLGRQFMNMSSWGQDATLLHFVRSIVEIASMTENNDCLSILTKTNYMVTLIANQVTKSTLGG